MHFLLFTLRVAANAPFYLSCMFYATRGGGRFAFGMALSSSYLLPSRTFCLVARRLRVFLAHRTSCLVVCKQPDCGQLLSSIIPFMGQRLTRTPLTLHTRYKLCRSRRTEETYLCILINSDEYNVDICKSQQPGAML